MSTSRVEKWSQLLISLAVALFLLGATTSCGSGSSGGGAGPSTADSDNDGLLDTVDNCPAVDNLGQEDGDGDNVGDVCDNCPGSFNPSQRDTDSDGLGDLCDPEPCPLIRPGNVGLQQNSALAVDSAANFFVVWEADSNENDLFQIRGKAFNPDGTVRIPRFTVNFTSLGQQLSPAIAVDGGSRLVAVWQHDGNINGLFNVRARCFNADGTERIPEFTVNEGSTGQQLHPAIGMDSSGNFVVAWEHDGNSDGLFDILARGFNADGTERIPEFVVNEGSSGQQLDPAIGMDSNGNFVVVWEHDGDADLAFDILARGFHANGTERVPQFTVNVHSTGQQVDPVIAMAANGNSIVVWEHDGDGNGLFNINARGFNVNGAERIPQYEVNASSSGQQLDPTVAMNAIGNFVVAWEDDGDSDGEFHVRFRGFNADGTENFVQTKADCIEPAQHINAAIGIDASGRIRVFWDETPNFLGPSEVIGRTFP